MSQTNQTPDTIAATLTVITAAASVIVGWVSLSTAPGVTALGDGEFSTEFANAGAMAWAWWLPIAAAASAYCAGARWGLATAAAATVPQIVVAAIVVNRYAASGFGDGLEVLAYLLPIGVFCCGAALAGIGLLLRRLSGPLAGLGLGLGPQHARASNGLGTGISGR